MSLRRHLCLVLSLCALSLIIPISLTNLPATEPAKLGIGDQLPTPTLHSIGGPVELAPLLGQGPTLIAVFRGGWCPYCTKHLSQLQGMQAELAEKGFQIIAIAPDTAENLHAAADQHQITFPLLADPDFAFSNAVGLTFALDQETVKKYQGYGIPLRDDAIAGGPALPEPALLITDADGTIVYFHRNADYRQRLSPEDIRKALVEL